MDLDFYTKAEINAMLNGLSFIKISQEDFDALETKDENTIYYVYDDSGKISEFIGNTELRSGTISYGNLTGLINGLTSSIYGELEQEG